ncbi:hypothetical protein ACA910_003267 [Epithemia clementina (nom. ined.)]
MILIRSTPQFALAHTPVYFLVSNNRQTMEHDSNSNDDNNKRIPVYEIRDVQVSEKEDSFVLSVDLPGVKEQNVDIKEHNFVLIIEALRKSGDTNVCKFYRQFSLDKKSIQPEGIHASLSDGVLTVHIPKRPEPQTLDVTPTSSGPPAEDDFENVFFRLDMPGVKLSDLKVQVKGDGILISAERKKGNSTSSIKRMFTVDDTELDVAKAKAYLSDGVLTLTAPPTKKALVAEENGNENKDGQVTTTTDNAISHRSIPVNKKGAPTQD